MGVAKSFNKMLHKELTVYAAWLPVTNTFELGDYGHFEGGVFRKTGNIAKFGVNFDQASGAKASIDFTSNGARVFRMVAGTAVPSLQGIGDVEAKLSFDFSKKGSSVVKASIDVVEMQNIDQVGKQLAKHPDWEKYNRVVSALYTGEKCVIIAARDADTKVEFSGSASALAQIELGKVELKPSFQSSTKTAFKSVGETGPIGLGLFKIGWLNKVKLLGDEEEPQIQKDWGDEFEDDF